MYTDEGLLPRNVVLTSFYSPLWFSIHFTSGTFEWAVLIFSVHAAILLTLLVGYRSRTMHVLAYLMCLSLQVRNELTLHSGDVYMRVMLFFGMLLPTAEVYSIDAILREASTPISCGTDEAHSDDRDGARVHVTPGGYTSMAVADWTTVAVIGQVMVLYVTSCFHKSGPQWTTDYTATWYALQLDFFRKTLGDWFLMLPDSALAFLTWAVWSWEKYGMLLYISPFAHPYCRMLAALGTIFMHLNFGLAFRLAMFTFITTSSQLLFFPAAFWDAWLMPALRRRRAFTRVRLYYSTEKHVYGTLARIAAGLLLLPGTPVQPASANVAKGRDAIARLADDNVEAGDWDATIERAAAENTFVVVDDRSRQCTGLAALQAFCRASPLLFVCAWLMQLRPIAWLAGGALACVDVLDTLLIPAKVSECACPPAARDARAQARSKATRSGVLLFDFAHSDDPALILRDVLAVCMWLWRNIIAGIAIVCIFWWLYATLNQVPGVATPVWYGIVSLHLGQEWAMFSPHPPTTGFFYVIAANLTDNRQVDLFRERGLFRWHGAPLTWQPEPRADFAASIGNHRWFKYYEAFNWGQGYSDIDAIRLNFGRWICREWNARHEGNDRLWYFEWHMITHSLDHVTKMRLPYDHAVLWSHMCFDHRPPLE